ncbi:MAG: outer membrane protein assembly factor BamE [Parvibaculum sp.]|uniref:outer membrane protein assembly factor BamE n=1 Tax=Parvibaculum sp. TaxID=2024848 RepID=UPI003C762828
MTSQRLRRHAGILVAVASLSVAGLALAGCSPVVEQRGYVLNEKDLKRIKPGQTTKEEVREYMGSPSTESPLGGPHHDAYYYISSTFETDTFYPPEEVDRTVVAVYFDKQGVAQQVAYYGLQDGEIVDFQTRTTPSRGKELTVLGQLFSNLGRFNKANDKRNTGPVPGRPGG